MAYMPSIRWTQNTPHILGVVAAALVLAAPPAHADEGNSDASPSSPDVERRVQSRSIRLRAAGQGCCKQRHGPFHR